MSAQPLEGAALREEVQREIARSRELDALRDLRTLMQMLVSDGTVSMPAASRRAAVALIARTGELFETGRGRQ